MDIDDDDGELNSHELALGGTRPPLLPGLNMPMTDFIVFFMAAAEALMFRATLLLPIALAFIASLKLYRRDYNAGRCIVGWAQFSGRQLSNDGNYMTPRLARAFYGVIPRERRS